MSSTTATLLIAGAANLLPALFFMFTALLGSNGMNSAQGGKLLGTLAVLLRSAEGLTTMLYVDPRTAALQPGGKLEQGKTYTVIARAAALSWNPKDTQSLDLLSYAVTE